MHSMNNARLLAVLIILSILTGLVVSGCSKDRSNRYQDPRLTQQTPAAPVTTASITALSVMDSEQTIQLEVVPTGTPPGAKFDYQWTQPQGKNGGFSAENFSITNYTAAVVVGAPNPANPNGLPEDVVVRCKVDVTDPATSKVESFTVDHSITVNPTAELKVISLDASLAILQGGGGNTFSLDLKHQGGKLPLSFELFEVGSSGLISILDPTANNSVVTTTLPLVDTVVQLQGRVTDNHGTQTLSAVESVTIKAAPPLVAGAVITPNTAVGGTTVVATGTESGGVPGPSRTYQWYIVGGPMPGVNIVSPNSLVTSITTSGVASTMNLEIRLIITDLSGTDESPGASLTLTVTPTPLTISGTITPNDLPGGATANGVAQIAGGDSTPITVTWADIGGAGTVTFTNSSLAATAMIMPMPSGTTPVTQVIRVTAADSTSSVSTDISVTVNPLLSLTGPLTATPTSVAGGGSSVFSAPLAGGTDPIFKLWTQTGGQTAGVTIANIGSQTTLVTTPAGMSPQNLTFTFLGTDTFGGSVTDTVILTVTAGPVNPPPSMVLAATPSSGTIPLVVNLNASASTDDGSIVSYEYDPNDGTAPITTSSTSIVHTYINAGNYTATVKGTDNLGATATAPGNQVTASAPGGGNNPPVRTLLSISSVTSTTIAGTATAVVNYTDADLDAVAISLNRLAGEAATIAPVAPASTIAGLTSQTFIITLTADPTYPLPKTLTIDTVGDDGTVQVPSAQTVLTVVRENRAKLYFGTVLSSSGELTLPNGTPGALPAGPGTLHLLTVAHLGTTPPTAALKFGTDMGNLATTNNEPGPAETPILSLNPYQNQAGVVGWPTPDAGRVDYWYGMPLALEQPAHDYGVGQMRTCTITIRLDVGNHKVWLKKSGVQAHSTPFTAMDKMEFNGGYLNQPVDGGFDLTVTQTPPYVVLTTPYTP